MTDSSRQVSTAYLEGKQAFLNKELFNTNPHEEDSVADDEWNAGGADADDENEGMLNHSLDAFDE